MNVASHGKAVVVVSYDDRLAQLDLNDPDRAICGHAEDVSGPPDGSGDRPLVHLVCTRLVTNRAGVAGHAGVHYDRRHYRWFDRVTYPDGKLRVGRTGDHLR